MIRLVFEYLNQLKKIVHEFVLPKRFQTAYSILSHLFTQKKIELHIDRFSRKRQSLTTGSANLESSSSRASMGDGGVHLGRRLCIS